MKLTKKYLYGTILSLSLGVGMSGHVMNVAADSNSAVTSQTNGTSAIQSSSPEKSGTIEGVRYTIKDGELTIYDGTIRDTHDNYTFPWQQSDVIHTIKTINIVGPLHLEHYGAYELFEDLDQLESVSGLRNVDTSKAETLSYLFAMDTNLKSVDLSKFDTSNVKTMSGMFWGDANLETIDISNFDLSLLTNTDYMFSGDSKLTKIIFPTLKAPLKFSKVDDMRYMFYANSSLKTLDLSMFEMPNAKLFNDVFGEDKLLSSLTLSAGFKNAALASLPGHNQGDQIPIDPAKEATGPGWQAVGANGTVTNPVGKVYPTLSDFSGNRQPEEETYVWEQDSTPIEQYTLDVDKDPVSLYQGNQANNWDPTSVIKSATKNEIDDKSDVTITDAAGNPVTKETIAQLAPGTYLLTYKNGDQTQSLTLTIKADQAQLRAGNFDLYLDQKTTEKDLKKYITAVDSDGQPLPYTYTIKDAAGKPVSIDEVSSNTGEYTVDITTDQPKSGIPALKGKLTIKVTDSSTLNLKYGTLTIPVNQEWQPEDAFDNAKDASGKDVPFKDIKVTAKDSAGKVISDLNDLYKTPGVYTVHYSNGSASKDLQLTVKPATPTPDPTPSPSPQPMPTPTPTPIPQPTPTPVNPVTPAIPVQPSSLMLPDYAAKKGAATAGINNLYMYRSVNFSKRQRIAKYVKKPRIYRPMFVVTGYARSASGKLRYKVRDVNHLSKTAGKTRYITASWQYVRPVYYATKHTRITVISPRGVNAYKRENLTGKVKNYKQGTVLKVKGIVKHNLTTRFILTNGKYVTANRKLVNMGRHRVVKKVRAKTTVNRYQNVNLSKRNHTFKKGKVFRVYNYDYSHGYNLQKHGALRYRVVGGYITGNSKYVTIIK